MDLPKRTKQQKSEAHSYAILLYKLRDIGVFRNLTENDYGIDFELELILGDKVTARIAKIQVKSAEKLKLRADKTPSIGGIKQSTLNYWCELSYRNNVIAYAVDLDTETVYASRLLFWQATKAIDGSNSSKSITFMEAGEDGDYTAKFATIIGTLAPNASDHVYAHTLALRRLKDFINLLDDAYHYDSGTEIEVLPFRDLIETARILLWEKGDKLWSDEIDQKNWQKYEYWVRKSETQGWDGLSCHAAQPILSTLLPAIVEALSGYHDDVIAGKYYWAHRNPEFLKLVYETALPPDVDVKQMIKWNHSAGSDYPAPGMHGSYFVEQSRIPSAKKAKKEIRIKARNRISCSIRLPH